MQCSIVQVPALHRTSLTERLLESRGIDQNELFEV